MRGLFITMEGPDGSGKSSLLSGIIKWFSENKDKYGEILVTKEPGSPHNEVCKKIRNIVLDPEHKIDKEAEIYLMMADRCNHVNQVIRPALEKGNIVISDRYADSTYAYQGWGRRHGDPEALSYINLLNSESTKNLTPDLTILLMVEPEVGLSRATKTEFGKKDRFEEEKIEFHRRVCDGYRDLFRNSGNREFIVVDTSEKDQKETFIFVKSCLENYLAKRKI